MKTSRHKLLKMPNGGFDPKLASGGEAGFAGAWGTAVRVNSPCLNKCIFCNTYKENIRPDGIDKLRKLINRREGGAKRLFLYGEVLTHPRVLDILDCAGKAGFKKIEVQCSGEELSSRTLVRDIAKRGVASVSMPIYCNGPLNDRIVGRKGSWKKIISALDNLNSAGVRVRLHTILMNINLSRIGAVAKTAAARGASFCVLPLNPKREVRGIEKLMVSYSRFCDEYRDSGLCLAAFPLCVIKKVNPGLFKKISASGRNYSKDYGIKIEKDVSDITFGYTRVFNFVKSPVCRKCRVKDACPGIFPRYLKLFSDKEFEPAGRN